MEKEKPKVCIITAADITFLGGLELYQRNLISYLKKYADISLIYRGREDKEYIKDGIKMFQIRAPEISLIGNFFFESKVKSILKKYKFDVINSHGLTGLWMRYVKKHKNTKIVHTYHGSTYHFYKNHLRRFGRIKRIILTPVLILPYLIEGPAMKRADKIICVSEHVMRQLMKIHGQRKNISVIRTGVDISRFKPRDKDKIRKNLNIRKDEICGLYIGRGGFWTKGLDKIVGLARSLYELDKRFRLIIVGANEEKVKHLIDYRFSTLLPPQTREDIIYFYNASNIFFSMSRCDGGAPTMVTSEAMASGCLIVTDNEANQEIFEDEKNGIIVTENYEKEAKRILSVFENKNKLKKIISNSLKSAKELSLDKWAKRYLNVLNIKNHEKYR